MLKLIFKNYDKILETGTKSIAKFFAKEGTQKQESKLDALLSEIKLQQLNLEYKKDFTVKQEIQRKIIFLTLKYINSTTSNKYLRRAWNIVKEEYEDALLEALEYLNRIPISKLDEEQKDDLSIFKALIYEALEEYNDASKEYKRALKEHVSPRVLQEYKNFITRYQIIMEDEFTQKHISFIDTIHETTPTKDLPKVAKTLENLAKYYARSPKSRYLAKRYFKETLAIYKKLISKDRDKYLCEYIKLLIDGVETIMLSPIFLKKAQNLLSDPDICTQERIYFLERLKELKEKNFIKKSYIFRKNLDEKLTKA